MRRQLTITGLILGSLILGTILVIFYGRGYRLDFAKGRPDFLGTGLLVATSTPDGAEVYINGHLTTATANTINLSPGNYTVRIFKDGYFSWEKNIKIQKEVVTKVDALLFPTAPQLQSITNVGVKNPVLDPFGSRLAYAVASQSARKNGIFMLDLTARPILTLQSSSTQVVDDTIDQFSNSKFSFSPDGTELIATTSAQTTYLLTSNSFNSAPQDVTTTLSTVASSLAKQAQDKEKSRLDTLATKLKKEVTDKFKILEWSLDDSKILYQASKSADLPIIISPRLIGTDTKDENRNLEKGKIYVYDIKEDKNYRIDVSSLKNLHWFPDSSHLILVADQRIDIMDYDGDNRITIYAGPFVDSYVFPWPDSSKVVILTNLGNPDITPNLYTIVLK